MHLAQPGWSEMQDQPQNLRGLKALVGIMAVLIVIGTTVVIGTVIHRLYARFATPSTPASTEKMPVTGGAPSTLPLGAVARLAPGEHISGIASAGGKLAVWVSGPAGDRLLLLNPVTGQVQDVLRSR